MAAVLGMEGKAPGELLRPSLRGGSGEHDASGENEENLPLVGEADLDRLQLGRLADSLINPRPTP